MRRFETFDGTGFVTTGPFDRGRLSLSVTAGGHVLPAMVKPKQAPKWTVLEPLDASKTSSATTLIVVRMTAPRPIQDVLFLARLNTAPDGKIIPGGQFMSVAPVRKKSSSKGEPLDTTYVVSVPPGRWQLVERWPISFCLGSPAFDVAEGAAVFAGTFAFGVGRDWAPDLDIAPAKRALEGSDISTRIQPAAYVNGVTFPCETLHPTYLYALEVPGAPFVEGSPGGEKAP